MSKMISAIAETMIPHCILREDPRTFITIRTQNIDLPKSRFVIKKELTGRETGFETQLSTLRTG